MQEWLDTENVVIGTKCNRLLLLNTTTRQVGCKGTQSLFNRAA